MEIDEEDKIFNKDSLYIYLRDIYQENFDIKINKNIEEIVSKVISIIKK